MGDEHVPSAYFHSKAFFESHETTMNKFHTETFGGLLPMALDPCDKTHQVSSEDFHLAYPKWKKKFHRALYAMMRLDNPEYTNSLGSLEEYSLHSQLVLYEACRRSLAANPIRHPVVCALSLPDDR